MHYTVAIPTSHDHSQEGHPSRFREKICAGFLLPSRKLMMIIISIIILLMNMYHCKIFDIKGPLTLEKRAIKVLEMRMI